MRLAIVGEGLERQTIQNAIRRGGLERQVFLVGHVNDVRPYYRAADMMAISSLSEGSPNAMLEAMASGIPVVSYGGRRYSRDRVSWRNRAAGATSRSYRSRSRPAASAVKCEPG